MKQRLLLFLAVLLTTIAYAQKNTPTQTIKGVVIDNLSGFGLGNVTVRVEGISPAITALTDSTGNFRLQSVPIGRQVVRASSVGFEDAILTAIEVTAAKEVVLEVRLKEKISRLDAITVKAGLQKNKALNEAAVVSARRARTS